MKMLYEDGLSLKLILQHFIPVPRINCRQLLAGESFSDPLFDHQRFVIKGAFLAYVLSAS